MYIQPERRKQATVQRLVTTRGVNGNITEESYTQVYGSHVVDLQPRTTQDLIANEQLKFKVTHSVYPEQVYVFAGARLGDFYSIGQKLYRIVEVRDYIDRGYFKVHDEAAEKASEIAAVLQSAFTVDNLGPGVYTYGSGLLAGVGPFSARPLLLDTLMNDGSYYINNPTTSGFEIVDRLMGAPPVVSVYVKGALV